MALEVVVGEYNTRHRKLLLFQALGCILILRTRLILWNGIYGNAANSRLILG